MGETCLILNPHLSKQEHDAADILRQQDDVKAFQMAVKQADLADPQVVKVRDVSTELVQRIFEADFIVVDANSYGRPLSPPISYFVATGHASRDRTLLLTRSIDHLPTGMRHNVVVYEDGGVKLFDAFKELVEKLRGKDEASLGGNPIQEYLSKRAIADHRAELNQRSNELDEREEKLNLMEVRRSREPKAASRISFRKIGG